MTADDDREDELDGLLYQAQQYARRAGEQHARLVQQARLAAARGRWGACARTLRTLRGHLSTASDHLALDEMVRLALPLLDALHESSEEDL